MRFSEALDIMAKGHQEGVSTGVDPALSATYRRAVDRVHAEICEGSCKLQRDDRHALAGPRVQSQRGTASSWEERATLAYSRADRPFVAREDAYRVIRSVHPTWSTQEVHDWIDDNCATPEAGYRAFLGRGVVQERDQ